MPGEARWRRVHELDRARDVADASGDDPMIVWAAQGMRPGVRAWEDRGAVVVASARLFCRDRLVVAGPAEPVADLVRYTLAQVGPSFRLFGDADLVDAVVERSHGLVPSGRWGWMDTTRLVAAAATAAGPGPGPTPRWLARAEDADVRRLLAVAFPDSYAQPGQPGVSRWAGLPDPDPARGGLLAAGADAWSAPGVGFVSGVASGVEVRGQGHATSLCRFLLSALLAEHGRVALQVDDWNAPAIKMYERFGLRYRAVASAEVAASSAAVRLPIQLANPAERRSC